MKVHVAAHSAPLLQSSLPLPVSSSGGEVRCACAVIVGAGFGSKSRHSDLLQLLLRIRVNPTQPRAAHAAVGAVVQPVLACADNDGARLSHGGHCWCCSLRTGCPFPHCFPILIVRLMDHANSHQHAH